MSEPARWLPDDDALDIVARSIDHGEPPPERAEHNRTAILAAAATRKQQPRHSRAPFIAIGGVLAAAAIALVVIRTRSDRPRSGEVAAQPKQVITPIGVASYAQTSDWPDFVVRDDDGMLGIVVAALDAGERFRVRTSDGEVEVRGARFEVAAAAGRLASVVVREGRAEVRWADQPVVILSAGQRWTPPQTAQRDELGGSAAAAATLEAPIAPVVAPPIEAPTPPARPTKGDRPRPGRDQPKPATGELTPVKPSLEAPVVTPPPPVTPVRPGEAEFRAGMAALRSGDAKTAETSFAAACTRGQGEAIGEDACFWSGAAAKRAGDVGAARAALARFLKSFGGSARAPEAAALLGWILYDAGDLDGAEPLFRRAEGDRVPQVRESATRGLTAIARRRTTP